MLTPTFMVYDRQTDKAISLHDDYETALEAAKSLAKASPEKGFDIYKQMAAIKKHTPQQPETVVQFPV